MKSLLGATEETQAARSFNLSCISTQSREKHTAEPVQFGTAPALFKSFSQCFSASVSACSIASRASGVRSARCKVSVGDRLDIAEAMKEAGAEKRLARLLERRTRIPAH